MEDFRSNPQYGRWWDIKQPKDLFNGALKMDDDNLGELVIRGKESDFVLLDRPPAPTTIWGQLTSEPMLDISIFRARNKRDRCQARGCDPGRAAQEGSPRRACDRCHAWRQRQHGAAHRARGKTERSS